MTIFDELRRTFSFAGEKAKQKYDTTKIELRIRGYQRELRDAYGDLGELVYQAYHKKLDLTQQQIDANCKNIDALHHRIGQLEKLVEKRATDHMVTIPQIEATQVDAVHFNRLQSKQDDIKIKRTDSGIQLIRFCPSCDHANPAHEQICELCGHPLKIID